MTSTHKDPFSTSEMKQALDQSAMSGDHLIREDADDEE